MAQKLPVKKTYSCSIRVSIIANTKEEAQQELESLEFIMSEGGNVIYHDHTKLKEDK